MDSRSTVPVRRVAKVGHRKSRNGCNKCKTRRVKCNEVHPVCSNCQRLGLPCSWSTKTVQVDPPHDVFNLATQTAQAAPRYPRSPASTHASSVPDAPAAPGDGLPNRSEASPKISAEIDGFATTEDTKPDIHRFVEIVRSWSGPSDQSNAFGSSTYGLEEEDYYLPESRSRRLLEHRLMLNYLLNLSLSFPQAPNREWREVWTRKLPPMALKYDSILYALLAQSATNLLSKEPENKELFDVRQTYLISAIREQRRMVETMTLEIADAVCLSSLLILVNSFAMLDERTVDPYNPPLEWLRLGRGSGSFIWMSVGAMMISGEVEKSVMYSIAEAQPRFGFDESYFEPSNREHMTALLTRDLPSGDIWDGETREAYEKTLSYIGSIFKSVECGEPLYVSCRRIQGFTMVVPPKFVDFVSERRPRALVILAHFFAAVSRVSGVWWLGGNEDRSKESIAKKELRGIQSVIPAEWKEHMIWPLDTAGISRAPPDEPVK